MNVDKTLTCADCGQEFTFTASEQDFYAERGFTEPRRCGSCRAARKAQRNADGGGGSESQAAGSYGAGGSYSAGGLQRRRLQPRWRRRRRLARPARDVPGHLLVLRAGDRGPVPADLRQARLLQRLLRAARADPATGDRA